MYDLNLVCLLYNTDISVDFSSGLGRLLLSQQEKTLFANVLGKNLVRYI